MFLFLFLISSLSFSTTLKDYEKYYQETLSKVKDLKVVKKYKDGVVYTCQGENVAEICGSMGCTSFDSFMESDCHDQPVCFPKTVIKGGKDHFAGEYKGKPYAIQCEQYLCRRNQEYLECENSKVE